MIDLQKRIGLCIILLIILSFPGFAANETQPENAAEGNVTAAANTTQAVTPAAKPETKCGNKVQDAGETCFSCAQDVKCRSGEMCTEEGQCVKQANFTAYIIMGIGIFALLALFFVAKRITKKPEEPLKKPEFLQPGQKPAPVKQPEKPAEQKAHPAAAKQPEPAMTQGNIATPMEKPQEKPKKEEQNPPEDTDEHKGETQIQKFIRQRRETGWRDEQIRQKMKDSGWKDTQIALEFLKAPKFLKKR